MKSRKYRFYVGDDLFYLTIDKVYEYIWSDGEGGTKSREISYEEIIRNDMSDLMCRRWLKTDCNNCLNMKNVIRFNLVT